MTLKNISGTALMIGLALTPINGFNETVMVNNIEYSAPNLNYDYYDNIKNLENIYRYNSSDNCCESKPETRLKKEAEKLFGTMRDATISERKSVNDYIDSISEYTGVNFFDLC